LWYVVDDTAAAKAIVVISGPTGIEVINSPIQSIGMKRRWNLDTVSTAMWSAGSYTIGLWIIEDDNQALLIDSATIDFVQSTCVPDCAGRTCGFDGCGGQCAPGCDGGACLSIGICSNAKARCEDGWCLIPAGTFQMGSPDNEPCREISEGPLHVVTITRPFLMKQTEVTQGEWQALIGNNPSRFRSCGPDCPVERVSWIDAVQYANLLSDAQGFDRCYSMDNCSGRPGVNLSCRVSFKGLDCGGYRLPTESEWEYAARAGTETAYWSGGNIGGGGVSVCDSEDFYGISLPDVAWYDFNSRRRTHPVGLLRANAFGLYDVHGNVWEFANDGYSPDYYATCAQGCTDPLGPPGSSRVVRGGSWSNGARALRSAYRYGDPPEARENNAGFRLSRTLGNDADSTPLR